MKHTYINFSNLTETVCKEDRKHEYKIEKLNSNDQYMYFYRNYVGDKNFSSIEYHLFPNENIGIYIRHLSDQCTENLRKLHKIYVDMVSVKKEDAQWIVKDLYLDVIIKQDGSFYVVDVDEFADAIRTDELTKEEIDGGLKGLDNILKAYYRYGDINLYIKELTKKYT